MLLLFGVPPAAAPLFVIPPIAAALTVVVVVLSAWVWPRRCWSLGSRPHYSLVAIAAIGFIGLLVEWGLLGF